MPTNQSNEVCFACGAMPGSRHLQHCSAVANKTVYPEEEVQRQAQELRKHIEPGPHNYNERTCRALESIAMSLDALTKLAVHGFEIVPGNVGHIIQPLPTAGPVPHRTD